MTNKYFQDGEGRWACRPNGGDWGHECRLVSTPGGIELQSGSRRMYDKGRKPYCRPATPDDLCHYTVAELEAFQAFVRERLKA